MKKIIIFMWIFLLFSCYNNQNNKTKIQETNNNEKSSNDSVVDSISDSPRHQEWVEINNWWKIIYNWVVYPQTNEKSSVVLLIHENKWLTSWVRNLSDKLALEWYIVIAPDLLSSFDDDKKRTSDFETEDEATQALYSIKSENIVSDLQAVVNYAKNISASNGNIITAWFCWWWSQSFLLATQNNDIKASMVFYWTAPEDESLFDKISVPVYWFYAWNDERVNSTIEQTEINMNKYDKFYDYKIYDWAWHAFMRLWEQENSIMENKQARDMAWERMKNILSEYK